MTDGSLVSSFGTGGIVTISGPYGKRPVAMSHDAGYYIYIVGMGRSASDNNFFWMMFKINKGTGD